MMPVEYVKDHGNYCTITVEATPGASRTEIAGTNPWRKAVQIRIAAEAREGEANAELIRFLAERFSIPTSSIEFVKGHKSSLKVIRLPVTAVKAREILGGG